MKSMWKVLVDTVCLHLPIVVSGIFLFNYKTLLTHTGTLLVGSVQLSIIIRCIRA